MSIKDYSADRQPYFKCLNYGPAVLSDAELIAVLIKCGTKEKDSIMLAEEILKVCGDKGITSLGTATRETLLNIHGIGEAKAVSLLCIAEIAKRYKRGNIRSDILFSDPETIADYYMDEYRFLNYEVFSAICLDTRNKYIDKVEISKGGLDSSSFEISDVLRSVLKKDSKSVILMHNHPSGDPIPSRSDMEVTKALKKAFDVVGILLLDHLIIGDNKYFSFKEAGIING